MVMGLRVVEFMSFLGRAVDPRNFNLFKQLYGLRWVGYEFGWFSKWVSNESGISYAS